MTGADVSRISRALSVSITHTSGLPSTDRPNAARRPSGDSDTELVVIGSPSFDRTWPDRASHVSCRRPDVAPARYAIVPASDVEQGATLRSARPKSLATGSGLPLNVRRTGSNRCANKVPWRAKSRWPDEYTAALSDSSRRRDSLPPSCVTYTPCTSV